MRNTATGTNLTRRGIADGRAELGVDDIGDFMADSAWISGPQPFAAINQAPTFTSPAFAIARVSTDSSGAQANSASIQAVFSPDGSKILFASSATNLVAGDTNGQNDVFIKDLATGAVTRISTDSNGAEAIGGASTAAVFSPDGSKVTFSSTATNLVAGDTNGQSDIFVKVLATGAVTRISTDSSGAQATGGASSVSVFSPDGSKIMFSSSASNLVAGDTNGSSDVFIKDLATGAVTRVSTDSSGAQAAGFSQSGLFSPDGSKIVFTSSAGNLVAGDSNVQTDIFVKDLATGAVTRVSTDSSGAQATAFSSTPVFSPDGTKIAFVGNATNLVAGDTNGAADIFVKDLVTGATTRVSTDSSGAQATGIASNGPAFSPDGSKILFASGATNLVAGDTNNQFDVFMKDLVSGATSRWSIAGNGAEGAGGGSQTPIFSPDGSMIMFTSSANNLVAGDTNGQSDIFVASGQVKPTYFENGVAAQIAVRVNVADVDNTTFPGGSLTIAISAGAAAGDLLALSGPGISISGDKVSYMGVEVGTLTASPTSLSIALNGAADAAAVKAIAQAATFATTSDTPAAGDRTITFTLVDGGGTADGGSDRASFAHDVSLTAANDAPNGTDTTVTFYEDSTRTLSAADFGLTDVEGNALLSVTITTLPGAGTLRLSGTAVTVGQSVTAANLAAGNLVFTPVANANGPGYASFTFQVRDDGGTANGGVNLDPSPNTLTFDVTPVNDAPSIAADFTVTRVSTAADGAQGNNHVAGTAMFSPDGTRIAFQSQASNLVAGDTNNASDVFMKDLATGAVTRVSVSESGQQQLNGADALISFSTDKIAFSSGPLIPGDTNNQQDVYVKNLTTGVVTLVSVAANGTQGNSLSMGPVISPDGTKILFTSVASNLVAGDTNGVADLFLKDLTTGGLTRLSTAADGSQGNQAVTSSATNISYAFAPDGSSVLFTSNASNLVANDTNAASDLFVKNIASGAISRVSTDMNGVQANGASLYGLYSPDGTKITFYSSASNLVANDTNATQDIFVKDLATGAVTRVSTDLTGGQSNAGSFVPVFSPDGKKVAFYGNASNLVAGDRNGQLDVFVKDLTTGEIIRVSTSSAGVEGNNSSLSPVFSPDSQSLLFVSAATNLVAGDTNARQDAFLATLPPLVQYVENGAPAQIAANVSIYDMDNGSFGGGTLSAAITVNAAAGDQLSIAPSGSNVGIDVAGSSVLYNGNEIGILTTGANGISIALDGDATISAVEALTAALRFATTSDTPGIATRIVTITLADGGGTANGGTDTSSFTRSIAVTVANDAPSGADHSTTVLDNAVLTFTASDFSAGLTDPEGNSFAGVRITDLPSTGTISLNGAPISAGQLVTLAQLNAGALSYQPAAGARGTAPTFTFQVQDDGGTANGGVDLDQSPNLFTVTILSSNAAPVLDLNGPDAGTSVSATTPEQTDVSPIAPLATLTDPDSANFDSGSLTVSFGAGGTASDFFLIHDDGGVYAAGRFGATGNDVYFNKVMFGTRSGGIFGQDLVVTLNGNATPQAVEALIHNIGTFNDSDAPPSGARTVTFTVTDGDGGTAKADASITIVAQNDAPVNGVPGAQAVNEDAQLAFDSSHGNTLSVSDADAGGGNLTVTLSVGHGLLTLSGMGGLVFGTGDGSADAAMTFTGTAATINTALDGLIYAPAGDYNGADSLSITTSDNGATGAGGAQQDVDTVALNIAAVNDAPTATITPGGGVLGPVGNEILVNTATANAQQFPQMTALSNGGFVVTWLDGSQGVGGATGDSSGSAVKAQVFAAGGTPVGSEILVSTATEGDQGGGQITALSNGGFVVTWADLSQGVGGATGDSSSAAVKAQVFAAGATAVGSEIRVNTATDEAQQIPRITALSNGGFVVTWSDSSQGVGGATGDSVANAVKAQVFAAGGTPVGSEILVNSATAGNQANAQLTALSNGGFVVTWQDMSAGVGGAAGDSSSAAIKAQVFGAGGTPVGNEILVNTAIANAQQAPQITSLSNGGFVVTWLDGSLGVGGATGDSSSNAVKAQVFAAGGAPVGSEILVNTAIANAQQAPQITALSNGGFVVTWLDGSLGAGGATGDSSATAIKAQLFAAGGSAVGSEILVNTATASGQSAQQVTALSNGGFVVTWQDFSQGVGGATGDSTGNAVKAQVFAAGGARVGSEMLVNTATASDQTQPQIKALSNGGFVVTWTDNSQGVGGATGDTAGLAVKAQVFGPAPYHAIEQTALSLKGGLAVADADSGSGIETATVSVDYGILHLAAGTSGATITNNVSGAVTITGTIAQINALLSSDGTSFVTYTANGDAPPGSATLTLLVNDGGNSGSGGALSGSATTTIGITAVNDAPVNIVPVTQAINEDMPGTFSTGNGNEISVSDPDAGAGSLIVTLSVAHGLLTLSGTNGLAFGAGDGSDDATMTFTGTAAAINTALNGLTYAPTANYEGADTLSITTFDNGNSGTGGARQDADTVAINITNVDDAPVAASDNADVAENAVATIAVLDNDTDVDGGPKMVASVDGTALSAGQSASLASGAIVTLNNDGTLSYDPNHAFDYLVSTATAAATGSVNDSAADSFTYALNGNSATTVTVTIGGVDGAGDHLNGDGGDNVITGTPNPDHFDLSQGGSDAINGLGSNDDFYFGAAFTAADQVDGGAGNNDRIDLDGDYSGGNALVLAGNTITNIEAIILSPGYGYDLTTNDGNVAAGSTLTVLAAQLGAGHSLVFNGSAETGGRFVITAGQGDDSLTGGYGNDVLDGGAGTDAMAGGRGNDAYVVDSDSDVVTENANEGTDEIQTSLLSYTLHSANVENLAGLNAAGQTLVGDGQANRITGEIGNDIINGLGGNDTMLGGEGDDRYFVDQGGDMVLEASGEGYDRVLTSVSYVLAAGSEIEKLTTNDNFATTAIDLTGNELGQYLFGNAGANRLDGAGGADVMVGLGGDDRYYIDTAADRVIEGVGEGYDRVLSAVSWTLQPDSHVDKITTIDNLATTAINLTGNNLGQYIFGNSGANKLDGGGGGDVLAGLGGNDVYVTRSEADRVIEDAGGGNDRVLAGASFVLQPGSEVEVLSTIDNLGTAAIDLTGNALSQYLFGNEGANVLDGKLGNDILYGFGGTDTFEFTTVLGAGNVDRIADFATGVDKIALDDFIFVGLSSGALPASAFHVGSAAHDADDRIIYDNASGTLYYDYDGSGIGTAVAFATLNGAPILAASDFMVI